MVLTPTLPTPTLLCFFLLYMVFDISHYHVVGCGCCVVFLLSSTFGLVSSTFGLVSPVSSLRSSVSGLVSDRPDSLYLLTFTVGYLLYSGTLGDWISSTLARRTFEPPTSGFRPSGPGSGQGGGPSRAPGLLAVTISRSWSSNPRTTLPTGNPPPLGHPGAT
jgi:hypothetical protein